MKKRICFADVMRIAELSDEIGKKFSFFVRLRAGAEGMSRVLLKLAKRSLPLMILRDFELLVKIPSIPVIRFV